jgi:hypothetical protein
VTVGPRRNIELKARCPDLARAAEAARKLGATRVGALRQHDTYFVVPTGRLKLREMDGKPAELVFYQRANEPTFRGSDDHICRSRAGPDEGGAVGGAGRPRRGAEVPRALDVAEPSHPSRRGREPRHVSGIGSHVRADADEAVSRERLTVLTRALDVRDEDRIAVSYRDLAASRAIRS